MGRLIKNTTWDITLKKITEEGTDMKTVELIVNSTMPTRKDMEHLEVDGWSVTTITLKDTHYE